VIFISKHVSAQQPEDVAANQAEAEAKAKEKHKNLSLERYVLTKSPSFFLASAFAFALIKILRQVSKKGTGNLDPVPSDVQTIAHL
jgi:hypothetical protein